MLTTKTIQERSAKRTSDMCLRLHWSKLLFEGCLHMKYLSPLKLLFKEKKKNTHKLGAQDQGGMVQF